MKVSENGLRLIKEFEGLRLKAYQDSVGIWTIGYGHTAGVKEGDVITEEQATEFLRDDAIFAEQCVSNSIRVPVTQNEFDALVAFTFNVGCGNFRKSTLLAKLNEGDYEAAAREFHRWNKAGGQVLAGLTRRRAAEAQLFETA